MTSDSPQSLEAGLKVGGSVHDRVERLSESWRLTSVEIDRYTAAHSVASNAQLPQSAESVTVAALERLLEAAELYDPAPVLESLEPLLMQHNDAFLTAIEEAVKRFDFAQAAAILRAELQARGGAE